MTDNVIPMPCPYQLADVDGWHPCALPRGHEGPCAAAVTAAHTKRTTVEKESTDE